MPDRAEILDTLAAAQKQLLTFFQGLSLPDLARPVTPSENPGGAPWRAKDHLAHLTQSERNIQLMLRATLAGETREAILTAQYPPGMELPNTLGDLDALTPQEKERLVVAVAKLNQTCVDEHHDDSIEKLIADYLATRQETLDLVQQFSDDRLAAPIPTVGGEQTVGNLFVGRAGHEVAHIKWIEEGFLA